MRTNPRHSRRLRTCLLLFIAGAAGAAVGCSPVLATGPNAVGVHLAGVSYPSSPDDPSDEVHLDYAAGTRVSYSRRLFGVRKLWIGPEATVGFAPESRLWTSRGESPEGVSRSFAVALLRLNAFGGQDWAPDIPWLYRFGFGFGAGIGYGRFSESTRLIDGSTNPAPRADSAFGPAFGFGMDYQITRHVVSRVDGIGLMLEPDLSFKWPKGFHHKFIGGLGIVFTF